MLFYPSTRSVRFWNSVWLVGPDFKGYCPLLTSWPDDPPAPALPKWPRPAIAGLYFFARPLWWASSPRYRTKKYPLHLQRVTCCPTWIRTCA